MSQRADASPRGAPEREPGSFRDFDSRVFHAGAGRVCRALSADALADWEALETSGLYERLVAAGKVVQTSRVPDAEAPSGAEELLAVPCAAVLEHERIPFVSYPYEWPLAMLRDAARLQIDILLACLDEGITLRDATPYNIQWRGAEPVFVDMGSFQRLGEGRPWLGYRQFCMLFLYPLMLRAHKAVDFRPWLRGRIEGIPPGECAKLFTLRDWLRAGVFKHVALHARLEARYSGERDVKQDLERAGFGVELVKANVRAVGKVVERLSWAPRDTAWSGYSQQNEYGEEDAAAKRAFVSEAAATRRWERLWDLGCNDGTYTRLAAEHARAAIAIDADEGSVDALYRKLREEGNRKILPLVMDLTDPSPELGWRGRERRDLSARGRPDLVLALALVHHLSISGGVPVQEVIAWLGDLGAASIIEFVTREDPMADLLLARKEPGAHPDYDREHFEAALRERFAVERELAICGGRRVLYFAHPRT